MARWIQEAMKDHRPGRLHQRLGIPQDKRIPHSLVDKIIDSPIDETFTNPTKTGRHRIHNDASLKSEANFVRNMNKRRW
jgi:hypothetical protein